MKIFTGALVISLLLIGCDTKKKLDGMVETTNKMNETTGEMNQTTKDVKTISGDLSQVTDDLYTGMREVESVMTQAEMFENMKKSGGTMEKAHYALVYFAAFEFQSWQGQGPDDEALRERMYTRAVELFFSHITDLIKDSFPLEQGLFDSNWMNLSVLAMTMAKVHPEQVARAKAQGFTPTTFYDILQRGMRAKARFERGEEVKEWELAVLEHERVIGYLMQLRHNFFKVLVLGQISDIEDGPLEQIGKICWWCSWQAPIASLPKAETLKLNEWLWKSWETQAFLRELGIKPLHNKTFTEVYKHGTFLLKNADVASLSKSNLGEKPWSLEEVRSREPHDLFLPLLNTVLQGALTEPLKVETLK